MRCDLPWMILIRAATKQILISNELHKPALHQQLEIMICGNYLNQRLSWCENFESCSFEICQYCSQ